MLLFANYKILLEFLSTPSVGRATGTRRTGRSIRWDFYPRPPWGGRPMSSMNCKSCIKFLSTPSVGRATHEGFNDFAIALISIHALRGEGD